MGKGNKTDQSRRRFLQGAGLLLGSVGVPPIVQNELLSKIAGLPKAHAAGPGSGVVDFFLDVCWRAGSPFIYLGTGPEFADANLGTNRRFPNVPMQQTSDMALAGGSGGARPLYVNMQNGVGPLLANPVGANGPVPANYIAITQGLDASSLGHESLFCERRGGFGGNLITPVIEFAERTKARPDATFVLGGVNFFRGNQVTNNTLSLPDLTDVGDMNSFGSLFRQPTLRLTQQEVGYVIDAARRLSSAQAQRLSSKFDKVELTRQAHEKAGDLVLTDFSERVNTTQIMQQYPAFNAAVPQGWRGNLGQAVAGALLAFSNQLMPSATVTVDSNDWHGFQTCDNNPATLQTAAGRYVAGIIRDAIAYMSATPHPFRPGENLFQRTLITFTSEFTRGISEINNDNNDGGTNGFVAIGGMIRGGYYGAFNLGGTGGGQAFGFDLTTGAPTMGMRSPQGTGYHTVAQLLGNNGVNPARVANCMIRT